MSDKIVSIIEQTTLSKGFYRFEKATLQHVAFEGGWVKPITREFIIQDDSVSVLLFDPKRNQLVFVEQFRVGAFFSSYLSNTETDAARAWILEIVAGAIEPKEKAKTVAIRETKEESGLIVQELLPILQYFTSPANSIEKMTLFCGRVDAAEAKGVHGLPAEGENIRVFTLTPEEAYQQLDENKIFHAPTLIALQWFRLHETWVRQQWSTKS